MKGSQEVAPKVKMTKPVDVEKDEVMSKSSRDFEEKMAIQFGNFSLIDCNVIMAIPKSFQARLDQLTHLVGDVADFREVVAQIAESKAKITRSVEVVKSINGDQVVLLKLGEELIKHPRPLYVQVHLDGVPVDRVLVDNGGHH